MWLFRYRAFPLRSFFATGHFHNVAFPLRGISTAWFFVTWHFYYVVFTLHGISPARYIHGISVFSAHSLLNLIFQYSRYPVQELHVCSIVLHFLAAFEGVMLVFLFHIFYGFLTLFLHHPYFLKAKRHSQHMGERSLLPMRDTSDRRTWREKGHYCFKKAKRHSRRMGERSLLPVKVPG